MKWEKIEFGELYLIPSKNGLNCHVLKKVYTFYINTKIRLQFKYNPKIDLQSPFFCNNFSIYNLPF